MMCEPKQGEYLDEHKEDVDTEFIDKLMNMENNSYMYEKEERDVDERSIEDLKDCFAETNQHGKLEKKASAETEVPYVFKASDMCLTAGCTSGTEGQLLNIVQQFEEYEDKIKDMWNANALNIYLLILLQVLCKRIGWILNEEAELSNGNRNYFHWLKENIEEEIVLRDNMAAQDRA